MSYHLFIIRMQQNRKSWFFHLIFFSNFSRQGEEKRFDQPRWLSYAEFRTQIFDKLSKTFIISRFESGYFNPVPWTEFLPKFVWFSRNCFEECPLFFEKTIHSGGHEKISFFPWRSPSSTYYSPNVDKSPKKTLISKVGVLGGKGRTPGER